MKRLGMICFVSAFILFSCKNEPASPPVQTLNDIMQADSAADVDKVISLYTDDAILIPSDKSDIVGINAIRENYRNIFATSTLQLKATASEIIESGELTIIRGYTNGNVISKKDSSSVAVNDKFLMMLKKQSGKWKIYRLMWSKKSEP
jgi:ketosteroid isomerase-like protein